MNDKKKPIQEEEKVFKIVNRVLPGMPKFFKKLGIRLENIDFSQPQALTKAIEKDFLSIIKPLSQFKMTLLFRFFKRVFLNKTYVKQKASKIPANLARMAKNAAKSDSRYSLLMELIYEADNKYPYSPFLVTSRHGDLGKRYLANMSPIQNLNDARKSKGEVRAANVHEAMRKVTEYVYKPYIQTLWQLSYIRNGENLPFLDLSKEIEFGNMLKVCLEKLPAKYHSLIEPNAVIMRNSASHSPLDYDMDNDVIIIKDRNLPPFSISVNELLEKIESMYVISCSTIALIGQIYFFRLIDKLNIVEKVYDLMPELLSENEQRIKQAEQNVIDFLQKSILQDLESYPLKSRERLNQIAEARANQIS